MTFEIHNRHPTMSQQIRLDLSANQMTAYGFNPRINELDREFQLGPDQRRTIQIEIDPSELAMTNLDEASKTLNFTLEIDADLDTVEYMHTVTFIRLAQVEEAENAIREYRAKMRKIEEEMQAYEDRYNQNEQEMEQMKQDMQAIVSYKNELEEIVDQQTSTLSQTSKRATAMEESLRFKEQEFEK